LQHFAFGARAGGTDCERWQPLLGDRKTKIIG
jgi:hypothetical protein